MKASPQAPAQYHNFTPQQGNWNTCAYCGAGPAHSAHLITRKGITGRSHVMHLILDFLTAGLWIPFHILFALRGRSEVAR